MNFPNIFSEHPLLQKFGNFYKSGKINLNYYIVMRSNTINGHLHFIYNDAKGDFTE